ncbi:MULTISPECIES: hypothetical protein [unclassified Haladaptatus]|uniref:DUF7091 family protein n=1 Tax=unclassified Haladaptatus TaxID=2622732 RepID=UPI0023E7BA3F|nr:MULTISPECIES: hypothetical protein [unclassified Haladaptatus]
MSNRRRIERLIRQQFRKAGRQMGRARHEYREGRGERSRTPDAPETDGGREMNIVCRRYAERRTVSLDAQQHPHCFDAESVDCQGCLEDIREGIIETW